MDKQWLIKINEDNNLYYDSEKKVYRLRLFCPHCHKPSDCHCYENYEDYEYDNDISSGLPVRCCSYLCCLLIANSSAVTEDITKAILDLGINVKPLAEYTEKEAEQIIDYIVEEFMWDVDEDTAGEQCSTLL